MTEFFSQYNTFVLGILASVITGLSTGIGAFFILFTRKISGKFLDGALGVAAGIMMASTSFSLVIPAIESAHAVAYAIKLAKKMGKGSILINLSGRGDKDMDYIIEQYGIR